jgi:hypothetical protein
MSLKNPFKPIDNCAMKISAHSIKKVVQEKELEKEKAQLQITQVQLKAKEAQAKRNKFLDDVLVRCLNEAIEGNRYIDIGFEYPDLDEISNLLEDKFIEIVDILGEKYFSREIGKALDKLDQNHRDAMERVFNDRSRAIKFSLNEIRPYVESYYGYDELVELIEHSLNVDNQIQEKIIYLLKANLSFTDIGFEFDDELPQKTKDNLEISKSEIEDDFKEIAEILGQLNLREMPGEDDYARKLKWEKMEDEDVINNWTNDSLDAISFAYLATLHGQLFVHAFKSAIEEKMLSHEHSIDLELLKYSSGYLIRLENKAEMYTVYDEIALNKLFKKLGYLVKVAGSDEDEFRFTVSWKD